MVAEAVLDQVLEDLDEVSLGTEDSRQVGGDLDRASARLDASGESLQSPLDDLPEADWPERYSIDQRSSLRHR